MATVSPAEHSRLLPYARDLGIVSAAHGQDPYLMAAIMLRESGAGNAPGYIPQGSIVGYGDNGHAFGLFQIDRRYHATFLLTPAAQTFAGQAGYAADLLTQNRKWLASHGCPAGVLEQAMICAYNASIAHVLSAVQAIPPVNPDLVTTHGDYGSWVIAKATALRSLAPSLFSGPV